MTWRHEDRKTDRQQKAWTEEEDYLCARRWREGFSATLIARELGTGRSRNAVIGRLHRLGLSGRPEQAPRKTRINTNRVRYLTKAQLEQFRPGRPKKKRAPQPPTPEAPRDLAPIDPALTTLKLSTFTCRYPLGDPRYTGFTYCGRTCEAEAPYCRDHHRLCYVPGSSLERRTRLERLAEVGRQSGVAA